MSRPNNNEGIREIVLKSGETRYEARLHLRGYPEKSKTFKTRKEAIAWKRAIEADLARDIPVVDKKKVDIGKIIDDYLNYRETSRTPLPSNQITEYEKVKEDLGDFRITNLTQEDVENWIHLLLTESRGEYKNGRDKGTYAEASVRKFYYCFKKAVEWHSNKNKYHVDEFLFKHPDSIIPAAWNGKRERRLAKGEEERLYAAGIERKDTYTRLDWERVIGFDLETALREQELVYARWRDLRQDGYKLFVPKAHTKTKRDRYVLLSGKARAIVDALRAECPEGEERIFFFIPDPNALCDAFARLTVRAKCIDLHFHDLRHEATSRLCESGQLNIMQLMEMTDHSSMTTFKGYLHLIKEANVILK